MSRLVARNRKAHKPQGVRVGWLSKRSRRSCSMRSIGAAGSGAAGRSSGGVGGGLFGDSSMRFFQPGSR
jgi:hypothetical protein